MRRTPTVRLIAYSGVLSILVAACMVSAASAGEFTVASCQADRVNFSSTAFEDFATRGMTVRRACNPEGPGIRGLVTANSTRRGSVPRGSVAMVAISAPGGTTFTTFRWAGSARRVDCRYSLQVYAEGPVIKAVPIKNVRANQGCPGRARGQSVQAAGYRSRTFKGHRCDAHRSTRHLCGRRRAEVVLDKERELHPHLQGRGGRRGCTGADRDDRG